MQTYTEGRTMAWSAGKKYFFLFAFVFFALYILPFPLANIPFFSQWNRIIASGYESIWNIAVPWVGKQAFSLSHVVPVVSGSGDTLFHYVHLFTLVALSIIAAAIWLAIDYRRPNYNKVCAWLRLFMRYFLACILLSYGFSKVFHVQMLPPTLYELIQPFGDKSPMGLAWSYVGYSQGFSIFTGLAEVIGGLMLLFRITLIPGLLLNTVVVANIVVMNFFYDVPVKIYSSMLLIMTLFLLAPFTRHIIASWNINKDGQQNELITGKWKHVLTALVAVFFILVIWSNISGRIERRKNYSNTRMKPPLYGLYNISQFIKNNDTVPLLLNQPGLWKNLVIEFKKNAVVKYANDSMERFQFIVDTNKKVITISPFYNRKDSSQLNYRENGLTLTLSGKMGNEMVDIHLIRDTAPKFRLTTRGFNWINERPYHY